MEFVNLQSGIYEIVNAINGKRYVGSAVSIGNRFSEHRCGLKKGRHHSRHLQNAFNKHGIESFIFKPILICNQRDLLFYEQRAIDFLKPEYNMARVAGNTLGTKRTPEAKAKISKKGIGRPWSDEAKAKLSATLTGRKMSDQAVQKLIGNQHAKGHKHTDEWKAANSIRQLGMKRPKSPEYRAKIAAGLRGRKATPEHRANQAAAQRGTKRGPYKPWSPETRARVTALRANRKQIDGVSLI